MTDRTVYTRLKADISDYQRGMLAAAASTKAFTKELNTSTDRSTMLTQSLLAVGPALVPISAAAIPAMSGLANQMGFAVAGAGAMVLAFSGVGDALKATNDYAIEPTEANLEKMRQSMSELGPAGREFVSFLQGIRPEFQGLQDAAQAGMFPGMESGITDLMSRLPQVERIVGEVSGAIGDLMAEAGANLAGPRWDEFFTFLETEARPTLMDFGRSLGNLGEGFANLWMAFDPLSDTFSKGFLQMARDFAEWTDGLDQTQGFQEFVEYIQRVGPKAWDTLGALGNALLQLVEAAAPVGEAMLPAIEALADAIATLADSDVAPLVIGIVSLTSAMSRLKSVGEAANSSALGGLFGKSTYAGAARAAKDIPLASRAYLDFGAALDKTGPKVGKFATTGERLGASLKGAGKIASGAGGLAFVMSDLDEKMGLSNAAMGAMAGTMFGPWGAAIGGGVGLAMDFASANDDVWAAVDRANQALGQGPQNLELQRQAVDEARQALADYKDDIDVGKWELPSLGDFMKKAKNDVEGLVGSSDEEELTSAIREQADAYAENARAAQDLKFAEAGLGSSMDDSSESARNAAEAMLDLIATRNEAADAALSARAAENAYQAAIDDAAKSVEENGKTLDKGTEAGRANRAAVDKIADSFNKMDYATQQANGGLKGARKALTDAAVAAGATKREAQALAEQLIKDMSPPPIEITLRGAQQALTVAQNLGAAIGRLRDKTVTITTVRKGADVGGALGAGLATGGPVIGPGTGTSDDIPAMLSNGEHVLTANEVIKAGGQGAIYRMRAAIRSGTMPAFAAGGAVTKLDIKEQEARVRDIQRELNERETVKRGGRKVRRDVLRGLDREIARLQLAEAKKELWHLRNRTEAKDEIREEALERTRDTKESVVSGFKIGSLSSAAAVDRSLSRMLADSSTFLGLLGDLKKKGASPWLLSQLVEAGPTKGAIRLATQYNTDQAALNSINAQAKQIDQFGNTYAGLVGNARFMQAGAWNSGVASSSQTNIQITATDISQLSGEIGRVVRHELAGLAAGGNV